MSEHPTQPGSKATVAPTPEQAAEMAANMLQSAVSEKSAIAQSFDAQREAVLRVVNERKAAALQVAATPAAVQGTATDAMAAEAAPLSPGPGEEIPYPASQGWPQPSAPNLAGGETKQHAFPGVDFETLKVLRSLTDPRVAVTLEQQSLVMGQIVCSLRELIAREVRAQLATAGVQMAPATERPVGDDPALQNSSHNRRSDAS